MSTNLSPRRVCQLVLPQEEKPSRQRPVYTSENDNLLTLRGVFALVHFASVCWYVFKWEAAHIESWSNDLSFTQLMPQSRLHCRNWQRMENLSKWVRASITSTRSRLALCPRPAPTLCVTVFPSSLYLSLLCPFVLSILWSVQVFSYLLHGFSLAV